MARSQDPGAAKVNEHFDGYWFPARIIGGGSTPTTYELRFDAALPNGEEDRHDRTFPFLYGSARPSEEFLQGRELGTGTQMIRQVSYDCDYDQKLDDEKVGGKKRKRERDTVQ